MPQSKKPINFRTVIDWIFSPENEIPMDFIEQKSKLDSIVPYIQEQFWNKPRLIKLLNEYTNNILEIPDSIELLKTLKKLFIYWSITKHSRWQFFPTRKTDYIQKFMELDNYDENNARAKVFMIHRVGQSPENYFAVKEKIVDNSENLLKIQKAIEYKKQQEEAALSKRLHSNDRFIKKLTQELIDEQELTLFDVTLLKKQNKILLIFINKNNEKRYYLEPFSAEFYVSKDPCIINNDYIMDIDSEKLVKYVITDWKLLNQLKYSLNKSHKNLLNLKGLYHEG